MTITVVTLLKRKAGMSVADFRRHYEDHHRVIGEEVLSGYASRYVRRYLSPLDRLDQPHDYDVAMEIDFPDEATMQAFFAHVSEPAVAQHIAQDEVRLFDRDRIRAFRLDSEVASALND